VADEQERDALAAQRPHPLEEPLDRLPVELGGRLVEDDEPRPVRQRPDDLDQLPLLDRQPLGRQLDVDVDLPGSQQLAGPAADGRP
jgi:hypothetical protein